MSEAPDRTKLPVPDPSFTVSLGKTTGDSEPSAYLGVKIPPANIQDYHLETAREFADKLASRLASAGEPH